MIDALAIFENLKAQASTRQAKSLSILNDVLKSHCAAGERNFDR